ncbi:MAG: HI0074 family nucleotidyltransferase substrate-binding subunit [Eubacteriales bacterium]|nr:HI0074 family nucleotidyltransferase substrate-binding subunit [Eubacteriales bacterium]
MKKFDNFKSNLEVLSRAYKEDLSNEFIVSGIIDKFFIQFELSWKVLKELLRYEGRNTANTGSPREIIKTAYQVYDFLEEKTWLSMLKDRNSMTHIYDGTEAKELVKRILEIYIPTFCCIKEEIEKEYRDILDDL